MAQTDFIGPVNFYAVLGAVCYFIKISTTRHLFGEKFQVRKTGSSLTLTSVIVFLKRHLIRKNGNHFVILKCFCNDLLDKFDCNYKKMTNITEKFINLNVN
jgi:hypothetical protein